MYIMSWIPPPYDDRQNYFRSFIKLEKQHCSHQYIINPVEQVWSHEKYRADNDYFYYKLCMRHLYLEQQTQSLNELRQQAKLLNNANSSNTLWAFITVGWNEQTITPKKMLNTSLRIQKLKYFSYCDFVLEKHRENGIHHHTHFLVKFYEKLPPSKIINWIYTTSGVKEICLEKNFIDYLGPQKKKHHESYEVYYNYIRGKKKAAKIPYVAQDVAWRLENDLEHLYVLNGN